jgi:putative addiction module component (TIGR02574 family)
MQSTFEKIKDAAMTLPLKKRLLLADQLYMSLSDKEQAEFDAAWAAEAERRRRLIRQGKTRTIPGDQVLAEARALLKK